MIRKWLKINSYFAEILKSTTAPKNLEQKWFCEYSCKRLSSSYSLYGGSSSSSIVSAPSSANIIRMIQPPDDVRSQCSDDTDQAVAETPARTELFEVRGPNGSAFLIEVLARDLEEVRRDLLRLKGDVFRFDKTVIDWFVMKCILAAEPCQNSRKEQVRLARVHAISSGSEEVYEGNGKFFFVNAIDGTMRAKRILERLGYKISGILYRFQAKEKINLDEEYKEICRRFVKAVERLPKVISVIHNC